LNAENNKTFTLFVSCCFCDATPPAKATRKGVGGDAQQASQTLTNPN